MSDETGAEVEAEVEEEEPDPGVWGETPEEAEARVMAKANRRLRILVDVKGNHRVLPDDYDAA